MAALHNSKKGSVPKSQGSMEGCSLALILLAWRVLWRLAAYAAPVKGNQSFSRHAGPWLAT